MRATAQTRRSLPSRERELKPRVMAGVVARSPSLPSRERELKHCRRMARPAGLCVAPLAGARIETQTPAPHRGFFIPSLPSRERELKLRRRGIVFSQAASLPSRERELKLLMLKRRPTCWKVAPLAGARIETQHCGRFQHAALVAPLAGARIETANTWGKPVNPDGRSPRGSAN